MENLKKKINSSQDVVNIILKRQQESNLERIRKKEDYINFYCFKLNPDPAKKTYDRNQLIIPNIKSYYNFTSHKNIENQHLVETTIFSDREEKVDLGI